jgi:peptidoglycan/xylan/chitin deacetylase (PgdA/CDA1 family)
MRCDFRILHFFAPSVVLRTSSGSMHLTFDDGPHPVATSKVLAVLRERGLKATFFLLGRNCRSYPDLVRQVIGEGHSVGNHTYSHECLSFRTKDYIRNEIQRTDEAIRAITGSGTRFFRPPYGCVNGRIVRSARRLKLTCVLWDTDSKDFREGSLKAIKRRVARQSTNGSILLFHDNERTANKIESYLPQVLDFLLEKEITFAPLSV